MVTVSYTGWTRRTRAAVAGHGVSDWTLVGVMTDTARASGHCALESARGHCVKRHGERERTRAGASVGVVDFGVWVEGE